MSIILFILFILSSIIGLVSGFAFYYLVKFLRDKKKEVIVVSSRHHISKELIGCCNKYIDIRKLESVFKRMDDIK